MQKHRARFISCLPTGPRDTSTEPPAETHWQGCSSYFIPEADEHLFCTSDLTLRSKTEEVHQLGSHLTIILLLCGFTALRSVLLCIRVGMCWWSDCIYENFTGRICHWNWRRAVLIDASTGWNIWGMRLNFDCRMILLLLVLGCIKECFLGNVTYSLSHCT